MHVEFLLEEESAEAALRVLGPRLLPNCTFQFIPHQGKDDLLKRLPGRLKTYARRLPTEPELRVVVLMDADANCRARKQTLERLVAEAGITTKTAAAAGQPFQVITRLAVTELEAWFLGDPDAIQAAYSRVHPNHFKGIHTVPDEIPDAWETLWRVLQRANLYPTGKAKVEWAETIAPHLDPARNTSASFRGFCAGLGALR
ncbi:DUF4276 family protein [Hymenobacter nivis]|uniref:DUF4276 family protein n=1 Tax=Hymenobacter nivis TaxID=1850093 RepID=A0A2Z3GMM2_9BACT|nr:DUF4276 family protein [Hymenobacter nivis]AWM34468.1 hypothetical protein DDQ68_17760 [Hymenobacter nivis]